MSTRSNPPRRGLLALALASAWLGGCAAPPALQRPQPPAIEDYAPGLPTSLGNTAIGQQHLTPSGATSSDWWQAFGSPQINALVDEGLARNDDIAAARARLQRARQLAVAAGAEAAPQLGVDAGLNRTRYGAAFLGEQARGSAAYGAYAAGLGLSYDLDLSGRIALAGKQARAGADTRQAELDAVRLSVGGSIVSAALETAQLRRQLEIAQELLAMGRESAQIVTAAREVGAATTPDSEARQRQLYEAQARVSRLRRQLDGAGDTLAVLLGRSPGEWTPPPLHLEQIRLPAELPLTVPSVLLRQRPDIRAAVSALEAAAAQVGVATAERYPQLTLSASLSRQGLFGGPAEAAWSVLGGLSAPLLDGGRLKAGQQAAMADYQLSVAQYHQTVVAAFAQVTARLRDLEDDAAQAGAAAAQQASEARDAELARAALAAGDIARLQWLDAEQRRLAAELNEAGLRGQRLVGTAALLRSLASAPSPATGVSRGSGEQ